jgi:hypothetical protein
VTGLRSVGQDNAPDGGEGATEQCGPGYARIGEPALAALLQALRLNVGLGRRFSYAQLAEAAGISERKLRAIVDREQRPPFEEALRLACRLGPATVNAILAPYGYDGARHAGDHADSVFEAVADASGEAARFSAEASDAMADRHIDHTEVRGLLVRGERSLERMQRVVRVLREQEGRR